MAALLTKFEASYAAGEIPGAVLVAANKAGSFNYAATFGHRTFDEGNKLLYAEDTLFALASASKLITTIAVLQAVERGQVGLDDDVAKHLPELAEREILVEVKDGKGVFKKREKPITLRHLLTHSSGLAYSFQSPLIAEYRKAQGLPPVSPASTVVQTFNDPLIFEPGASWAYSPGIDWAGLLLARATSTDLETHLQQHVNTPLGIAAADLTFWPERAAASTAPRKAEFLVRAGPAPATRFTPFAGPSLLAGATEELGGQGITATLPAYLAVLRSLLADDGRLLGPATAAAIFQPQLEAGGAREAFAAVMKTQPPGGPWAIGEFPRDVRYDFGLGGVLTLEDVKTADGLAWRREGAIAWSGFTNVFWFLDRSAGVGGLFGTQALPPGDKAISEAISTYEKSVYTESAKL